MSRSGRLVGFVLTAALASPLIGAGRGFSAEVQVAAAGPFVLPALPYAQDALAPFISAETLAFHYGRHHKAYVENLNKLAAGKPEAEGPLFNNAAQVWNHTFYWNGLKPKGGGKPTGDLAAAISRDFGSFEKFREEFSQACQSLFGSGWVWLVWDGSRLKVVQTSNADLPMRHGQKALFVADVWEHAYYIDYRNERAKYVDAVLDHMVNWDWVAANLKSARTP